MIASGDARPLTWRQLQGVYIVIGLAVSLLLNRSALPTWMLAEYWGSVQPAEAAVIEGAHGAYATGRTELAGRDILFVGDSLTRACPSTLGDVISLNGATMQGLSDYFAEAVADTYYETIVLWPGTSHIRRQGSVAEYVARAVGMARVAEGHADHVLLVTPMPYSRVPNVAYLEYLHDVVPTRVSWAGHAVKRALADAGLSDVCVYDAGAFRSKAILTGNFGAYFDDTTHPNSKGFTLIWDQASHSLAGMTHYRLARP